MSFVKLIVIDFNLHVVTLRYRPFDASVLARSQLESDCLNDSLPNRLQFTGESPTLPAIHELDFANKNPNSLRLDLGTFGDCGLKESWLSARTDDRTALRTWKKIAKRLKGLTEQGATAINRKTGGVGPAKWHRFTEGAQRLESTGTPMLTMTGIILKPGIPLI